MVIKAMRGLPSVSFILLDEADFLPPDQQQDARDVSEKYIAKSDRRIVMLSTPSAPDGLFEMIEREPEKSKESLIINNKVEVLCDEYGVG
jgi:hypothetical protein